MTRTLFLTDDNIFAVGFWLRDYCWKLRDIHDPDRNRKIFPEVLVDDGFDANDVHIKFDIFDSGHYTNVHRVKIPAGARIEGLDTTLVPEGEIQPDMSIVDTTPDNDWVLLSPPSGAEEVRIRWCEGMFELVVNPEAVTFYTTEPVHPHTYVSTFYRFEED